jgi:uncharacterized protein (TIGR02284 family)
MRARARTCSLTALTVGDRTPGGVPQLNQFPQQGGEIFAMSHDACLSMLKDLIETSRDGERGFNLAVRDNQEPQIEDALKEGVESCRAAAIELLDQLRLLGGAVDDGTAKAPMYRGWVNFNAVPISRDTKMILEECERGGDYARGRYQAARNLELPDSVRAVIERHSQRLTAIQSRLRLLRNRYTATEIPKAIGYRTDHHLEQESASPRHYGV